MTTLAAIDCGTNMTRLLIRRDTEDLVRRLEFTRLGAGVDKNHRLDAEAVERTLAVLREFRRLMETNGVTGFRAVTTSATRDAENRRFTYDAESKQTRVDTLSGKTMTDRRILLRGRRPQDQEASLRASSRGLRGSPLRVRQQGVVGFHPGWT